MPRLSAFYGIVITMYWRESHHAGRPHFHATYAGQSISVAIDPLGVLVGSLPPRALGLVLEWAAQHLEELNAAWERVVAMEAPTPIPPLS